MNRNAVSTAVAALQRTGGDLVYGDLEIVDEHGNFLRMSYGVPFDFRILLCGINYIGQQTVFFRRELLERAGPLREEFDNAFDYELWPRMACNTGKLVYVLKVRAQIRDLIPPQNPVARADEAAGQWRVYQRRSNWGRRPARHSILRMPLLSAKQTNI